MDMAPRTRTNFDNITHKHRAKPFSLAGGSTLGNKLTAQINLRGVDMGAAQWAMHSVRETASAQDMIYIIRAFTQFFNA